MKLREYVDPFESQTFWDPSDISPSVGNASFWIDPHMFQLLPTFNVRFNEEPNDLVEEFTATYMIYTYPRVSPEHLKMRIFPLELKDKVEKWFNSIGKELISYEEMKKFIKKIMFFW